MVMRIIRGRWRLFLSGLVFLLTIATLLIRGWHWSPGFLIAWDVGVGLYLFLIWRMVAYADTTFIRQLSKLQDVGRYAVPGVTMVGALVSLAAVFHQLSPPPFFLKCCDLWWETHQGGPSVRPENLLTSPRGLSPGSRRGFLVGGRHESASAGILLSRIFFEALNSSEPQGPSASPLFRTRLGFEA